MIKHLRQCQQQRSGEAAVYAADRFVRYLCRVVFIRAWNESHMWPWLPATAIISAGVVSTPLCRSQRMLSCFQEIGLSVRRTEGRPT